MPGKMDKTSVWANLNQLSLLEHFPAIYDMLQQGCEVARAAAAETLADVKKAMKINYFDDKELIEEQVKRFSQE